MRNPLARRHDVDRPSLRERVDALKARAATVLHLPSPAERAKARAPRWTKPGEAPIDWSDPPEGFMAYPTPEPCGFFAVEDALPQEAQRLYRLASAEFHRLKSYGGITETVMEGHFKALRVAKLRAAAYGTPVPDEGEDDDAARAVGFESRPGRIQYRDAAGTLHERPVADWINSTLQRLYGAAQAEYIRQFSTDDNLSEDEQQAKGERLRHDLRLDGLKQLAFRGRLAPELDADLIALGEQWQAAWERYGVASTAHHAAEEQCERPERPTELRVTRSDHWRNFPSTEIMPRTDGTGKVLPYGEDEVEILRTEPRWMTVATAKGPQRKPDPQGQERADAIVAAWDRWQAEVRAVEEALNLPELRATARTGLNEADVLAERIREMPAATIAGLRLKARIAAETSAEPDLESWVSGLSNDDADAHAYAIVLDLLRLDA